VCDTLLPAIHRDDDPHGVFACGAEVAGTALRAEELITSLSDPFDRERLTLLLSTLGSPAANLLLMGRLLRFDAMTYDQREAVLRGWAHSSIPLKRMGFQALKRLVHVAYCCWPVAEGGHPLWQAAGYPGPLPQPDQVVDPVPAVTIDADTIIECDVVVVGSGAGGGVVAGTLAKAGRSVVVLEKGPNPGSGDMTQCEGDMLQALYLDGGTIMTQSGSLPILAGSCVGGGTVVNYTASFPLPERTRAEWDNRSGLSLFQSARFAQSLATVSERVNVTTRWSTPSARDAILERGCNALGWHVGEMPRNVTDCRGEIECGYCAYGCRHGAKNSTARTYLTDAVRDGARIIAHCDVERVLIEGGRAAGVVGTVLAADGRRHLVTVRSRVVVAAAGAIYTPVVLRRSGLHNPNIGRGLRLHPASGVVGTFDERVEPWSGVMQARYSDQFVDLDGEGYGVKFETAPVHFALAASAFGWDGARRFREDAAQLGNLSVAGLLVRDRDPGRVDVSRSGHPRVHYELSRRDVAHVREGVQHGAELLAAAGAREIRSLHTPTVRAEPAGAGWLERFTAGIDALGFTHCRMSYITFHQMASAAMGSDPSSSVASETGETHEVQGLYVADASAFPTSSGVNPMITIMAIADHVARAIDEAW
jgi:choline dehydrogenase-like flavoprotein